MMPVREGLATFAESGWALKEWAVTVDSLGRGEQIVLLRKGGIHEKRFHLEHDAFLLYPGYEHQRAELLKPYARTALARVLAEWNAGSPILPLTVWCRVTDVIEIGDPDQLEALSPHFIWTPEYAERRLHWRPKQPLEVLLVRAYRLPSPYLQQIEPYFAGCKSWIDLPEPVSLAGVQPALSDAEYAAKVTAVSEALNPGSERGEYCG